MFKQLLCLLFVFSLAGCGGSSSSTNDLSDSYQPPVTAQATVTFTGSSTVFQGNISFALDVADADGLARVVIWFGNNEHELVVCASSSECQGQQLQTVVSDFNPWFYGLSPGNIAITIEVTDGSGSTSTAGSYSVSWQPQQIQDVQITRNSDGTQLEVSWSALNEILRYNVYLAAQPGVTPISYTSLSEGQALLAINGTSALFTELRPASTYYVVVTGVDASGESAFTAEQAILPGNYTNNAPIAVDDQASMDEDTQVALSPLSNDSDPDDDEIYVVGVNASSGQAMIASGEQVVFTPVANFFGTVTIDYTIEDEYGAQDSAQISVTVLPINDPPVALDDNASTTQNTPITFSVLVNDSDVDGDVLTVDSASALQGTVVIESNQQLTYTPPSGFSGQDTINYSIGDGNGGTASAVVAVSVTVSAQPPMAHDDYYNMLEGTSLSVDASSGLLNNDYDLNDLPISVITTPLTMPSDGSITLDANGGFNYTPNANFTGTDSFDYEIENTNGETASASVFIDVNAVPANLIGESLSISGDFYYIGQGETSSGSGIGTGLYRIGNCLQVIDTQCSMIGEYQESPASGNAPGEVGQYAFMMSYPGTGDSPVLARSNTAGSNSLYFINIFSAKFELYLFPPDGRVIEATFPDPNWGTLANFGAFISGSGNCQGLPPSANCDIATVGLNPNSYILAPLSLLTFDINGYASSDISNQPQANDDAFQTPMGQVLAVPAPGVLANDTDGDITLIGDSLNVRNQVPTPLSQPIALAHDEFRQINYLYSGFDSDIHRLDRGGNFLGYLPWPGEGANDGDMDVAPVGLSLNNTPIPQGSLLVFNGETGPTEVYALDPVNGTVIETLNTSFGNSHVVGGAYNPVTKSIFLLQDNVPSGSQANLIGEVDPDTGAVLNQFEINAPGNVFNVSYGDLVVNPQTGALYLVSSVESSLAEFTRNGEFVRYHPLPSMVNDPSGIAVNREADRFWAINNSNSSPVYEIGFLNEGVMPSLISVISDPPLNGNVQLHFDGSFEYTPNSGFIGQDSFSYELLDQTGKYSMGTVTIEVTN